MDIQATGSATPAPARIAAPHTAPAAPAAKAGATAAPDAAAVDKASPEPDLKDVRQAVSDINKAMQFMSRELEFSVDTDSQRTVVKIIDQQTKEVIRQMPTAEALEIGKALEKVQGLLIRQTA
ncbi:MAG: flagellar protein FlaG [Janthinobacterium sp.]|jgi:flagellar protein FlaG